MYKGYLRGFELVGHYPRLACVDVAVAAASGCNWMLAPVCGKEDIQCFLRKKL